MCSSPKNSILCFKTLKILLTKRGSKNNYKEDQILIVDDWLLVHMQNPELICIFTFLYNTIFVKIR